MLEIVMKEHSINRVQERYKPNLLLNFRRETKSIYLAKSEFLKRNIFYSSGNILFITCRIFLFKYICMKLDAGLLR